MSSKRFDLRKARTKLGLSTEGLRVLLRMSESSGATIRRWQSGEFDVPGSVQLALELLLKSPEARKVAGIEELAARYPADTPGNPDWKE